MPKVVWMQMAFGEPLAYSHELDGSTPYLNRDWLRERVCLLGRLSRSDGVEWVALHDVLALVDQASEGGGG